MTTTVTDPTGNPDPAQRPGEHRLHERLGTTARELTRHASGSPARLAVARLITGTARDADTHADTLRRRIGQARDNLARLSSGGRLAAGRGTTVMTTLGAEIDQLTAQLDQTLDHLDQLIDAYEHLTQPTPLTEPTPLRAVPGQRGHRTAGPCPCACARPCGCGHAGCTAR
ncbi:hypothetical protein [Streptacidiphilus neutrinimicus]|uniref:hypothetical protein n=1 Tax=Streptacidiphilus neutrinimicus TaxID=105420 RepID=UPI0005A8CB9D|nr:hypothetical protein [Streptacidiphilus neutrinimicus]